jgi:uncharacterized protein
MLGGRAGRLVEQLTELNSLPNWVSSRFGKDRILKLPRALQLHLPPTLRCVVDSIYSKAINQPDSAHGQQNDTAHIARPDLLVGLFAVGALLGCVGGFSVFLGVLIGMVGGLFGIGGGLIAIPVLGLLNGMNQQVAQGTALVMIIPNVMLGFWKYSQRVSIDIRMACTLTISAAAFTYLTARFATGLDSGRLRVAFAVFLVLMAIFLASQIVGKKRKFQFPTMSWGWSSLVGAAGGLLSGMFGVGGATIAPPALVAFFGVSQMVAQGLALALIFPGTVIALATYANAGEVNWKVGVPLAIGGLIGVSSGVRAAHNLPEKGLRLLFCGLLVVTAAMLFIHR